MLAGLVSNVTAALAVITANRRQHRCVTGAVLERQTPNQQEQPHSREDFWEATVRDFIEEARNQNFRMYQVT